MKYTEEQAKEVLKDFKECVGDNCLEAVDTWLNTKYPKLPETGLVVLKKGYRSIVMRTGFSSGYGFSNKDYNLSDSWTFGVEHKDWRPATKEDEERWKELLIEEAKRIGFKEGDIIKGSWFKIERVIGEEGFSEAGLTFLNLGGRGIMRNGEWAEIIEDKKPTKEEAKEAMITLQKYLEL